MAKSFSKLDQALKDIIEAYSEVEEELSEKFGDDEEAYSHALLEVLEASIEGAIEEHDSSTSSFATILSVLTEGLEQLDPSAFEDDDDEEYELDEVDYEGDEGEDADLDDSDLDDADVDLDDEDSDDDEDDE